MFPHTNMSRHTKCSLFHAEEALLVKPQVLTQTKKLVLPNDSCPRAKE